MPNPLRSAALYCLVAATVVAPGCGHRLQTTLGPANRPPVVRLEGTASPGGMTGTLLAHLRWTASDPDGRVDHYLVTTDLARLGQESAWSVTTANEQALHFRRAERGAAERSSPAAGDFGFFAVRAVDDRGACSELDYRAFFGENIAPTVRITQPYPSALLPPTVPPNFWIRWAGSDPDGPNGRPAKYKFKLIPRSPDPAYFAYLQNPDSLRRQFAPAFAGWDSISGDSTRIRLTSLTPNSEYLFVITALDAEGAYDPVFSLEKNMLRMFVSDWGLQPRLTLFNEFFSYTYAFGGIYTDSSLVVRIDAPAWRPLTLQWYAVASPVSRLAGYRWALDIADITDETPRTRKSDLSHWSAWDLSCTSVTLGPFHGPTLEIPHRFYVEATDENGLTSLGIVQFRLIRPTFDRDLLIVNDTRFNVDQIARTQPPGRTDSLQAPVGIWPTRAELDTFLFAVGGVRWRMTPTGRLSPPGIFAGYHFDTLGTRRGIEDPTIPLEVLGHYRHVVWMVDGAGAAFAGSPLSPTSPMTTLQYMSRPNRLSTLAAWVRGGGRLWALGGGFGNATNSPWNNLTNDDVHGPVYSSVGLRPDLTAGRFMYDFAHWWSEFHSHRPYPATVTRAPFAGAGRSQTEGLALLPALLRPKSAATDPLPPLRSVSDFYVRTLDVSLEFLSLPNTILEDRNPSPRHAMEVRALDTLMVATNSYLPPPGPNPAVDRIVNPVMTSYHGNECGNVVFSGFDLWSWSRADCARLVDAVLQGIWHLPRDAGAGATVTGNPGPTTAPISRPGND
jgi:hypothetical protein